MSRSVAVALLSCAFALVAVQPAAAAADRVTALKKTAALETVLGKELQRVSKRSDKANARAFHTVATACRRTAATAASVGGSPAIGHAARRLANALRRNCRDISALADAFTQHSVSAARTAIKAIGADNQQIARASKSLGQAT